MTIHVTSVCAFETLDSRGRPTLAVRLSTADGLTVDAGVPSGASTGSREAVEVRDGDPTRYGGSGVNRAVSNVNTEVADLLVGRSWSSLGDVDEALIALDGTEGKSRLGANALVGVSMAAARAFATSSGQPLWRFLNPRGVEPRLPAPHFNVVNGGAHAANPLDFQEFMVAPLGAPSIQEAVRAGAEVYAALRAQLQSDGHSVSLGDEGGFAPQIDRTEDVLSIVVEAIRAAGYVAGRDGVAIALDPAASQFREDARYHADGRSLTSGDMVDWYGELVQQYPVYSIEDGLAEDDDEGWRDLTRALGARVQLVGDDNLVTNPSLIRQAAQHGVANAALIKVNQIGTVTETLQAMAVCRDVGYSAMVSHRSGETCDSFIADLAVGSGCGQLKAGAPARGERVAKYNRLMEISAAEPEVPFGRSPNSAASHTAPTATEG